MTLPKRPVRTAKGAGLWPGIDPLTFEPSEEASVPLSRAEALTRLAQAKTTLAAEYGVARLALFGSTARDEARSGSDVDVLVSFEGEVTARKFFGVQFFLEDLLGRPIDLVTEKSLRPELRANVLTQAAYV